MAKFASIKIGAVDTQSSSCKDAPQNEAVTSVLSIIPAQKDGRDVARTRA